jgi:hypothetical protein
MLLTLAERVWALYNCAGEECRTLEDLPVPALP